MHAADSGITVQFWETGCLTLVRWEYRDSKHKFLKLVFKRSDKWSHSYVHAFTSGTMLGTWHYIKFYDCRSTSGWWLMTMTSGSMIIDPFPHLFFFFLLCSEVLGWYDVLQDPVTKGQMFHKPLDSGTRQGLTYRKFKIIFSLLFSSSHGQSLT